MTILRKNHKDVEKHLRRAIDSIVFLSLSPACIDEMKKLDEMHDYLQELLDAYI